MGLFLVARAATFATGCGSKPPDGSNGGTCHESCTGHGCDEGLICNGSSNECQPEVPLTYPATPLAPSCTYYTSTGCDAGEITVECSRDKELSNSFACSVITDNSFDGAIYCCNLKPDCVLLQCDDAADASDE